MKANWKAALGAMVIAGIVVLQPQIVLGHEVSLNTSADTARMSEELALRKFIKEKKASFQEGEAEQLDLVGTAFTAKRVPPLVITDTFVKALAGEAKTRVEGKQHEPWVFPDVDVLKEKLEAIGKQKAVETHAGDMSDVDSAVESTLETGNAEKAKEIKVSKDNKTNGKEEQKASSESNKAVEDTEDAKKSKVSKASKYPIELLWTDKPSIFLHEDVHVGATRSEVLFAWGAPRAMWRDNTDGSLLWLYEGVIDKEKTITENKKSSIQKEEFSQLVKNTYTSDSLAGSNSSVGYVWLSLKQGKVTHLGMIAGHDWPRFAIPATTLETFKPNTMTESDFSLMGYRLGDTFTNDPNRSWEERGKLYGQEF